MCFPPKVHNVCDTRCEILQVYLFLHVRQQTTYFPKLSNIFDNFKIFNIFGFIEIFLFLSTCSFQYGVVYLSDNIENVMVHKSANVLRVHMLFWHIFASTLKRFRSFASCSCYVFVVTISASKYSDKLVMTQLPWLL